MRQLSSHIFQELTYAGIHVPDEALNVIDKALDTNELTKEQKQDILKAHMALVRVGWQAACAEFTLLLLTELEDVPEPVMDKLNSFLNEDNKREFVRKMFKEELDLIDKNQ